MLKFLVGFLIGLLIHRGYFRLVSWLNARKFEKASYQLARDIMAAQVGDPDEIATRISSWNHDITHYKKIRDTTDS